MYLYFLRHGEALEGAQFHDSERPLSNLGLRQAAAVGRFLREHEIHIEHVFCSPLLRARQTAEAVQREAGSVAAQTTEHLTSSSDPHLILLELRTLSSEHVLLIGHEPHLGKTISLLLGISDRSRVEMKTSSLACVTTAAEPTPGRGTLRWLLPTGVTLG